MTDDGDDHAGHDHAGHDGHDDHDDHDDLEQSVEPRPGYDPSNKELPAREPPRRSTAPQSEYTTRDVGVGFAVLLVGTALTFGLALALV